jgi:hypothetical protein
VGIGWEEKPGGGDKKEESSRPHLLTLLYNRLILFSELVALYLTGTGPGQGLDEL